MQIGATRLKIRLLRYYALGVTLFAGATFLGAVHEAGIATFDTITVHRIDVIDHAGRRAMVISNHDDWPAAIINGKVYKRSNMQAESGILFYNQIGNEQGALAWSGSRPTPSRFSSEDALLFDSVNSEELAGAEDGNENGKAYALLQGWDQVPLDALLRLITPYRKLTTAAQRSAFAAQHPLLREGFKTRYAFGYGQDNTASLMLADKDAKPRIKMFVTANGKAALQFLDANGKVVAQYPPNQ
jgi:hypothetical protein